MSKKNGKILNCKICNIQKYVSGNRVLSYRYCSHKCAGIARRGIIPIKAFKVNDIRITGKNNWQWKADNAGYVAKHRWIKKWYGKASYCEICKSESEKKYNWANISGDYKRKREDWMPLCIKCHREFDNHGDKSRATWYKNHPNYQKISLNNA